MWSIERIEPAHGTHRWGGLANAGRHLTFEETWRGWQSDSSFRAFWIAQLNEVGFDAYCWECPPVHDGNRLRPFECVFVSSPSLGRMAPQPQAFAEHFRADRSVATFGNLGGDAVLVAPSPEGPDGNYTHLACFTRGASREQQHSLWQAVGKAMDARVSSVPTWLSTAGHGVAWLHVRLDSSPKYYRHAEYMRA